MAALIWKLTYVRLALASRFALTLVEAWSEAQESWSEWNSDRGERPMLPAVDAFREDAIEWATR